MGSYTRKGGRKERTAELMEMFPDLQAARRRPARTLSGGQRTMLAIAGGLMLDPQTLLLDEPTAGLSPKIEGAVWERILAIPPQESPWSWVEQNTRRALQQRRSGIRARQRAQPARRHRPGTRQHREARRDLPRPVATADSEAVLRQK